MDTEFFFALFNYCDAYDDDEKKMMFTLLFIVELLALIIIIIVRSFNLVRGLLNSFRELKMRIFYGDMEQVKSKKKKKIQDRLSFHKSIDFHLPKKMNKPGRHQKNFNNNKNSEKQTIPCFFSMVCFIFIYLAVHFLLVPKTKSTTAGCHFWKHIHRV